MVLDKGFLAADKAGQMTGYITKNPRGDDCEGIAGSYMWVDGWIHKRMSVVGGSWTTP